MTKHLQHLRKLAVMTLAMLAISLNTNAQEWYIYGVYTFSAPHPVGDFHEYHYQGETVMLGGLDFQTIYVRNENNQVHLAGAYHTDGDQIVYCKWNGAAYEDAELLYDYDLEVGDYFHDDTDHPMQVTEVSTITDLNGVARKKITFTFLGLTDVTEFWVEGIGSNRGFMNVGMWEASPDSDGEMYHLLCYHEGNNVVFVNPEYNECNLPYGIEENLVENDVNIYPNPASQEVNILINNGLNISSIEIIDLTGRVMLKSEKAVGIDIGDLPEGQYFVKIIGETTIVRKLFIIK